MPLPKNLPLLLLYWPITSAKTPLSGYQQVAAERTKRGMKELEQDFYTKGLTVDGWQARVDDLLVRLADGRMECAYIGADGFHPVTVRTGDRDAVLCEWEALEEKHNRQKERNFLDGGEI